MVDTVSRLAALTCRKCDWRMGPRSDIIYWGLSCLHRWGQLATSKLVFRGCLEVGWFPMVAAKVTVGAAPGELPR